MSTIVVQGGVVRVVQAVAPAPAQVIRLGTAPSGDMLKGTYDANNDGRIDLPALGTGTPTTSTFLRGDGAWSAAGATRAVASVATSTTLTASAADQVVFVNAAGGAVTIILPTPTLPQGRITVKKTDTTSNAVTVSGSIEGAASVVLTTPGHVLDLQPDGITWQVV